MTLIVIISKHTEIECLVSFTVLVLVIITIQNYENAKNMQEYFINLKFIIQRNKINYLNT
jgi:hypothetical protein